MATDVALKKCKWDSFNEAALGIWGGMIDKSEARVDLFAQKQLAHMKRYVPVQSGNLRRSLDMTSEYEGLNIYKVTIGVNTKKLYEGMQKLGEEPRNYVYEGGWGHDEYLPDIVRDESLNNFVKWLWFEVARMTLAREFKR